MNTLRKSFIILIALLLVLVPFGMSASAQDPDADAGPSPEKMVVDALVVRPLGIVSMAVGAIVYLISLPFSISGGNEKEAQEKLVQEPTRFTFQRPLGDI